MLDTKLKVWVVILSVFALGCVTGASLDGAYRSRAGDAAAHEPRERTSDLLERIRGELNLSDEQAIRVRAVLDETRGEYRRLYREARPHRDRIRHDGRARIREVLTPEQRETFDRRIAERDARRREHEHGEQ